MTAGSRSGSSYVDESTWSRRKRVAKLRGIARSPFALMPLWIVSATALYLLGWSELLGPMRSVTLMFLAVVALGYLALAQTFQGRDEWGSARSLNPAALALISVYFIGAYIDNGGIPLLQVLSGDEYDVYGFGIDGLHIAMLCFAGYYAIRAFRRFLDSRRILDLAAFAWVALLLGSIANRSALSFLAFGCVLIFLLSRGLTPFWISLIVLAAFLFVFGFGVFGDVRLSHQIESATGVPAQRDAILQFAHGSDAFSATGLSPSWLWGYTYFVSPLANLNSAFAHAGESLCGHVCNIPGLLAFEFMPDVLGTRVATAAGVPPIDTSSFLVAHDVTATTMFGSAVGAAGLIGGLGVAALLAAVSVVVIRVLRGSAYALEGTAILGTVIFFGFFENMLVYTALSGQLAIVVLLSLIDRHSSWRSQRRRPLQSGKRS